MRGDNMKRRLAETISATVPLTAALSMFLAPVVRAETGRPLPLHPGSFTLKLETGVAIPLTKPQSQRFDIGGGQTIKALWLLNEYLDIGPSATFIALPADSTLDPTGTAFAFGGSVRVMRPHNAPDDDQFKAVSPWADLDLLYVRTGKLSRAGFAVAAGLSVPIGEARVFWLGPFVRYFHIVDGQRVGFDDRDAKILSIGLSLEVGAGIERERAAVAEAAPAVAREAAACPPAACPDRDGDGALDTVDHCPDVAGGLDNWGCPSYKKIVVQKDKLELREKLYFGWNQAVIQESSFPVLDEVVQALKDNKGFRVQVEGHTSSEGGDEHNQTLSETRAAAVLDYLAAHGIEKDRLVSKGMSSSVPADTNATAAGRENNRRVEFVVHFIIVNEGNK
jgi:outer membrane protein OmpA-like peptidoglycan-associated protein